MSMFLTSIMMPSTTVAAAAALLRNSRRRQHSCILSSTTRVLSFSSSSSTSSSSSLSSSTQQHRSRSLSSNRYVRHYSDNYLYNNNITPTNRIRQQQQQQQQQFDVRRYASTTTTIIVDDDHDHDDNDSDNDMIIEEEEDESVTTSSSGSTRKKPKKNRRQKKRQQASQQQPESLLLFNNIKLLHFRNNVVEGGGDGEDHSIRTVLEQEFDALAMNHDLSKFKWISILEKQLVLKLRQHYENDSKKAAATAAVADASSVEIPQKEEKTSTSRKEQQQNDLIRDLWKIALKASLSNKKGNNVVPDVLRDHFLERMIERQEDSEEKDPSSTSSSLTLTLTEDTDTTEAHNNIELFKHGRDIAVQHPLLWRRYSSKERKLKVKISKQLLQERRNKIDNNNEDDTITNNSDPNSIDTYIQGIRVPALQRYHYEQKTVEERHQEAMEFHLKLKSKLPDPLYLKILTLVDTYVNCFSTGSITASIIESISTDDDDTTDKKKKQTKKEQQKQFRVLLSNLRKILPQGRIHWIGYDIAQFFYVTQPDDVDLVVNNRNQSTDHHITSSWGSKLIFDDPILKYSEINYNDVRESYIQSLLNISKLFLQLEQENASANTNTAAKSTTDGVTSSRTNGVMEDDTIAIDLDDIDFDILDEDPSSEKSILQTYDNVKELTRIDALKNMLSATSTTTTTTTTTSTQRRQPRWYIPLEAMDVNDYWKTKPSSSSSSTTTTTTENNVLDQLIESKHQSQQQSQFINQNQSTNNNNDVFDDNDIFPLEPPIDRLVIIDSLPIDITKERLQQAYERCGLIDSIQIFNFKPELDPTRGKIKTADTNTKKIRTASNTSLKQKWSRPRTPLYAFILFTDTIGASKAVSDPLRIFGMVIDSHLIRSHRACDMKTLYLEDVSDVSVSNVVNNTIAHTPPSTTTNAVHTVLPPTTVTSSSTDDNGNGNDDSSTVLSGGGNVHNGNGNGNNDLSTIEYELGQLLHPINLYVCLDDSGHNKLRRRSSTQNNKNGRPKKRPQPPTSYKIKFPNFQAAYTSYWKLKLELHLLQEKQQQQQQQDIDNNPNHNFNHHHTMAPTTQLHWMETPRDAELYWTRKLNF